jgi:hypothetical protein
MEKRPPSKTFKKGPKQALVRWFSQISKKTLQQSPRFIISALPFRYQSKTMSAADKQVTQSDWA